MRYEFVSACAASEYTLIIATRDAFSMNAVYRATSLGVCLLLMSCGNKGDLYLQEIDLSAEEKALLDELDKEKPKKKKPAATQPTE